MLELDHYCTFPPVRNLHFIKGSILSPVFLSAERVPIRMTPVSVNVLWNPHLSRDVRCVRRRVIEILNKFFLRHLFKL